MVALKIALWVAYFAGCAVVRYQRYRGLGEWPFTYMTGGLLLGAAVLLPVPTAVRDVLALLGCVAVLVEMWSGRHGTEPDPSGDTEEVPDISEWLNVEIDADGMSLHSSVPGCTAWTSSFQWSDIERVRFKAEGLEQSDAVYVFTRLRSESFVIPTLARGGDAFWRELVARGHFDPALAITAATSVKGTFCWPVEPPDGGKAALPMELERRWGNGC